MQKCLFAALLLAAVTSLPAQYGGPRLFLDVPILYVTAPDVEHIGNRMGAGAEAALNVGTHYAVARLGGGATFTVDPKADDLGDSFITRPYALFEAGAGLYRSNGNRCANTHQSAFTALAKAGLRYDFKAEQMDYALGADLGYFFIADEFRNIEAFLRGAYLTKAETISADFGLKMFLNLRARR
jgi:hypothetical protein